MKEIKIKVKNCKMLEINKLLNFQGELKELRLKEKQKLKNSIIKNGFNAPIFIWDKKNYILDGHQRLKAVEELIKEEYILKDNKLPIVEIEAKTQKEAAEMVLTYNSQYGIITQGGLETFIEEFELNTKELEDILEFQDLDLNFNTEEKEFEDPEADNPEEIKTNIKTGDIIQLGNHRLMCGDSTKKEDVVKLMDGKKADMVFTDPPYGINIVKDNSKIGYGGGRLESKSSTGSNRASGIVKVGKHKKIVGDDKPFDPTFLLNYGKNQIIWGGNYVASKLGDTPCWLIWDKREGIPSNNFADCEIAWTSFKRPSRIYRHLWSGLLRKGNRTEEMIKRVHPTQKPVGLHCNILKDYSGENQIILDLFGGSGSTLIACEQLNRRCYMMEIDRSYCQVIINRWEKLTNKKAKKL